MAELNEVWKPVIGYEGRYEISDHGSLRRVYRAKQAKPPLSCLSPTIGKIGYKTAYLSHGKVKGRVRVYIHRLVAAAFIGPCPKIMVVNHKDADKLNNHASNLEYMPQGENARHASSLGLFTKGSDCHMAKLTEQDVREIRDLRGFFTVRKLQELYGVNSSVISEIQNRKRWKHVA